MPYHSGNYVELKIFLEDARNCTHPGKCDADVKELSEKPYIARQFAKLNKDSIRKELAEYGAWDAEELKDDEQNAQRLLWIFAGNVAEENR